MVLLKSKLILIKFENIYTSFIEKPISLDHKENGFEGMGEDKQAPGQG